MYVCQAERNTQLLVIASCQLKKIPVYLSSWRNFDIVCIYTPFCKPKGTGHGAGRQNKKLRLPPRANLKQIDGAPVTRLEARKGRLIASNTSHTGAYLNRRNGRRVLRSRSGKRPAVWVLMWTERKQFLSASEERHDDFLEWYYAGHPRDKGTKTAE